MASLIAYTHAPLTLLLQFLTFHLTLNTPNPRTRVLIFPLFLAFSALSFYLSTTLPTPYLAIIWAQSITLNIIHITSLLFIECIPAPSVPSLRTTYNLWSNPRLLPAAPSKRDTPSNRTRFLIPRLAKLATYYVLLKYIQPYLFTTIIGTIRAEDVAHTALFTRLSDLTVHEILVRAYIATAWIGQNYITMDGLHTILSVLSVFLGFNEPGDWPPLFGSVREIYSLRAFWGRFWHALARRAFGNLGRVVVGGLEGMVGLGGKGMIGKGRKGKGRKGMVAGIVFFVSGVTHMGVSWLMGWRDWVDLGWFMMNFAACLGETVVCGFVRRTAKEVGRGEEMERFAKGWAGRTIGALWVFAWFFWSVPLWQFERQRRVVEAEEWNRILREIGWLVR